ncbi:hypothetical protein [Vibrio owensii]
MKYIESTYGLINRVLGKNFEEIISSNFQSGCFEDRKAAQKFKRVIEIDSSAVLFTGVVKNFLQESLEKTHFSLFQLEENFEDFQVRMDALSELRALLTVGEIPNKLADQELYIKESVESHTKKRLTDEELRELLIQAPELTTEVDKMIESLRCMSFTDGVEQEPTAPSRFNDDIIATRNVSEIYDIALRLPDGISVVSILTNEEYQSHFVFIAKSAGKAILFTLNEVNVCPGRHIHTDKNCQATKSLLPFELFDELEYSRSRMYEPAPEMPSEVKVIGKISELKYTKAFTLILIFQRLSLLWNESINAPMAYTGDRLLESKSETNLPAIYKEHTLTLNPNDVVNVSRSQYLALCEKAELEVSSDGKRNLLVEEAFEEHIKDVQLVGPKSMSVTYKDLTKEVEFKEFPKHYLGTNDEMNADIAQIARQNKASLIAALCSLHFQAMRPEILHWLKDKVESFGLFKSLLVNNETLFPHATPEQAEYIRESGLHNQYKHEDTIGRTYIGRSNITCGVGYSNTHERSIRFHEAEIHQNKYFAICPYSGLKADLYMTVSLTNAVEISTFTGVEIDKLPFLLNTVGFRPYSANSNLFRVDPVANRDFANQEQAFYLTIAVNIKGLNKARQELGLPKVTKKSLLEDSKLFGK